MFRFDDDHYQNIGVGAKLSQKSLVSMAGRPEGGMVCLWKTDAVFNIDKVVLENNICVLCLGINDKKILLVNVYMNSDIWESTTLANYLDSLSKLEEILSDFNFDSVYMLGDFNADPFSGRAWHNLSEFMTRNCLRCFDYETLDSNTFTFMSYGNSFCKWLDHIIGKNGDGFEVRDIVVRHDLTGSDHLPLSASIIVKGVASNISMEQLNICDVDPSTYIEWGRLSDGDILVIENEASRLMGNFLSSDAVKCNVLGCRNINHINDIKRMYRLTVDSIERGSHHFAKERRSRDRFKVIPGWNRRVKQSHETAREDYLQWLRTGRIRDTIEFDNMKESRRMFKSDLRQCRANESNEISISVEEKYRNKCMPKFWKDVKRKKCNLKKSTVIDGKSENKDILDIFTEKFLGICQDRNGEDEARVISNLKRAWHSTRKYYLKLSASTLRAYSKQLSKGMGHDVIHSEFLVRSSDTFLDKLALFINSSYGHCVFPNDLLLGEINPTVKDLKGNVSKSSNYRPVMQSSCLLKIMEIHILSVLEEKVFINFRQFGFKKGCSTSDACYVLKETIISYTQEKGKAFVAFIDLSKAFDKVDHFVLGQQLLDRKLPPDIILLLMFYLRNQSARVCWNGEKGQIRRVESGVRQGGILSPFLFKLYIDSIINTISEKEIGCRLGFTRMNILAYADDIVLISDTYDNLDKLFALLDTAVKELKLLINKGKSKCIVFEKSKHKTYEELTLANQCYEVVNDYKYLGHLINRQLLDHDDIKYRLNLFYAQFNSVLRNFSNVTGEVLLYLFKCYCLPDYGLSLWNSAVIFSKHIFKTFNVGFSNALKKIVGSPISSSSHAAAETCDQLLLIHHVMYIEAIYFKRVFNSDNDILKLCSPYLRKGYLLKAFTETFNEKYECDLWSNSLDCLQSRISWVQRHESRRM